MSAYEIKMLERRVARLEQVRRREEKLPTMSWSAELASAKRERDALRESLATIADALDVDPDSSAESMAARIDRLKKEAGQPAHAPWDAEGLHSPERLLQNILSFILGKKVTTTKPEYLASLTSDATATFSKCQRMIEERCRPAGVNEHLEGKLEAITKALHDILWIADHS